jgi:Holliday junction resolvase RusA-like endonuclease
LRISFIVEGEAKSKARSRGTTMFVCPRCRKHYKGHRTWCAKCGFRGELGTRVVTFKDTKTDSAEGRVVAAFRAVYSGSPLEGALLVGIKEYRLVPKSWPKKKRALALEGGLRPTSTPDLDNVEKLCLDALNKIAYRDDSQVVGWLDGTGKYYSETARVEVVLETFDGEDDFLCEDARMTNKESSGT